MCSVDRLLLALVSTIHGNLLCRESTFLVVESKSSFYERFFVFPRLFAISCWSVWTDSTLDKSSLLSVSSSRLPSSLEPTLIMTTLGTRNEVFGRRRRRTIKRDRSRIPSIYIMIACLTIGCTETLSLRGPRRPVLALTFIARLLWPLTPLIHLLARLLRPLTPLLIFTSPRPSTTTIVLLIDRFTLAVRLAPLPAIALSIFLDQQSLKSTIVIVNTLGKFRVNHRNWSLGRTLRRNWMDGRVGQRKPSSIEVEVKAVGARGVGIFRLMRGRKSSRSDRKRRRKQTVVAKFLDVSLSVTISVWKLSFLCRCDVDEKARTRIYSESKEKRAQINRFLWRDQLEGVQIYEETNAREN